ncbi:MAG: S-layer homology domain-containing protein [Defluviitaleaceae bacterium]|nr:S-layer homology domain-containing protein [Defluviitaleaceae bacterium]
MSNEKTVQYTRGARARRVVALVLAVALLASTFAFVFGSAVYAENGLERLEYYQEFDDGGVGYPIVYGNGYVSPVPLGSGPNQVYVIYDGTLSFFALVTNPSNWIPYIPPQAPTQITPGQYYQVYARPRYGFSNVFWAVELGYPFDDVKTDERQVDNLPFYQAGVGVDDPDTTAIAFFVRLEIEADTNDVDFGTRIVGSAPTPRPVKYENKTVRPSFMFSTPYIPSSRIDEPFGLFPPQSVVTAPGHDGADFNAIFFAQQYNLLPTTLDAFYFVNPGEFGPHPVDIRNVSTHNDYDLYIGVESGLRRGRYDSTVVVRHGPEPVSCEVDVHVTVMRPVDAIDFDNLDRTSQTIDAELTIFDFDGPITPAVPAYWDLPSITIDYTYHPILTPVNPLTSNIRVRVPRPCHFTFFDETTFLTDPSGFNYFSNLISVTPPPGFTEVAGSRDVEYEYCATCCGEIVGSYLVVIFSPNISTPPLPTATPPAVVSTATPEPEPTTTTSTPTPTPTPSPEPTPEPTPGTHHAFMIGYRDGYVRPNYPITRAHVATIFFRLMSDANRAHYWSRENNFPDVRERHWFNNAVSTTTRAGIFTGLPDATFQPHRYITRAEFTVAAARFFNITLIDSGAMFNDISNHWAHAYINTAAREGWISGFEDAYGRFNPNTHITRAEAAALVNRMLGRLPETPDDLLPDMIRWPDNANPNIWYYLYIQEATNSHYFIGKEDDIHETWISIIPPRRWYLLERLNSRPEDIR